MKVYILMFHAFDKTCSVIGVFASLDRVHQAVCGERWFCQWETVDNGFGHYGVLEEEVIQ